MKTIHIHNTLAHSFFIISFVYFDFVWWCDELRSRWIWRCEAGGDETEKWSEKRSNNT